MAIQSSLSRVALTVHKESAHLFLFFACERTDYPGISLIPKEGGKSGEHMLDQNRIWNQTGEPVEQWIKLEVKPSCKTLILGYAGNRQNNHRGIQQESQSSQLFANKYRHPSDCVKHKFVKPAAIF